MQNLSISFTASSSLFGRLRIATDVRVASCISRGSYETDDITAVQSIQSKVVHLHLMFTLQEMRADCVLL